MASIDVLESFEATHPDIRLLRPEDEGWATRRETRGRAGQELKPLGTSSSVDFTVRSGGNDFYGRYVVDDGLIIDVRELNNVAISDDRQTASIGGGVTARSLASQLEDDGYICPVGNTGEIGYVGWATLGGYGPLTNKLGMGYEGIVGAEVVNARGEIVQAGEEMLEGIRGMGGNLGVITKLIIRIYPKFQLLSGMVMFEANPENVHAIVEAEAELEVPKEATMHYFIIDAGGRSVAMSFTWASDNHEKGKEFLDRLLTRLPPPKMNMVASKSLVGYFDSVRPPCLPWGCQRSIYVKELSTGLINILMDSLKVIPPQVNIAWSMTIQAQRAQSPPNCFGAATHMLLSFSDMTSSEDALAAARSWNDELYTKLRGSGDEALLDGSYPPLTRPADRTAEQLFGNKWPRARELKETFDPENVYKWAVPRFAA
ncbi:uncharacterized protein F5Z01DRAFT_634147 [Emericellopsis atlantica]|uniref:FAD-binding PCMH-type domain-containing protein n=1 Tax=Emericellopsis atlantica TaxID=2614577 RepID=A0A9P7ZRX0_9HYPO|nr:uncharacterized protein F5Z01DRAFT_634147 [Emericellopsis atlantica]KAG9256565.1 hypothetical protein F5Z01DRAFT_634147 [Emericellopsis atlantica]